MRPMASLALRLDLSAFRILQSIVRIYVTFTIPSCEEVQRGRLYNSGKWRHLNRQGFLNAGVCWGRFKQIHLLFGTFF